MQVSLTKAMKRRRMSKYALAKKAGLAESTVGRIANGKTRPSHDTVTAMEAALGLKAGSLVFHSEASR